MKKKIFISFNKTDEKYAYKIAKWGFRRLIGDTDTDVYSENDFLDLEGNLVQTELINSLPQMDLIIILCGDGSVEEHGWLNILPHINQAELPVAIMTIPHTAANIPQPNIQKPEVYYNPNAIDKYLRKIEKDSSN